MAGIRAARADREEKQILIDYVSPEGPIVTHVKGTVAVASLQLLKKASLYDRYLSHLSADYRDTLTFALAGSWLPVEVVMAHCDACDAMGLSDRELAEHGEMVAKYVGDSLFAVISRGARSVGMHNGWWFGKQTDRMWPRTYRGGGCTLLQTGPKDLIFEVHGLPMMTSRFYRASHHGYMKGFARMFSTAHFVKAVRPRETHAFRAATAISWV